jgi:hypothetical protein
MSNHGGLRRFGAPFTHEGKAMPLGIAQAFNEEDEAALEALRDPNEQPLEDEPQQPAEEGDAPAAQQQPPADEGNKGEPATDKQPAEAQPASAQAQPVDKTGGDPTRAQLRAARAAERRANAEVDRLRKENEELRAKAAQPKEPSADDELTDDDIENLAADYPAVAKVAKVVKKIAAQAPAARSDDPAPAEPQFVAPVLPDELQAIVDRNDELSDWQHDPDQTRFDMAKLVDELLAKHPQWKNKPLEERFAEVVKRVNAEIGQAPAAPQAKTPPINPRDAIDAAPARFPRSIGDIGTGGGRETQTNDLARFQQLSYDDALAELIARG